jgi:hypothetical protein
MLDPLHSRQEALPGDHYVVVRGGAESFELGTFGSRRLGCSTGLVERLRGCVADPQPGPPRHVPA